MKVIDCCLRHTWRSQEELIERLEPAWREFLGRHSRGPNEFKTRTLLPQLPFSNPLGDKRPGADRPGWPAGSSYEVVRDEHLDRHQVEAALLCHDSGQLISAMANHYLAVEVARAANQWTADTWLARDERLHGAIVAATQLPEEAAAEIRRAAASHPRFSAVLLGGNGLGKPFGHPVYDPIHAAAAELGLTLVVPAGGDAPFETGTETAAAGLPSVFAEYRILSAQPLMSHLVSFIAQGVFERHRPLRVLLLGIGAAWLPALYWRLEANFLAGQREVPWLQRPLIDYFHEHVRVSTWPLDKAPSRERLAKALGAFAGVDRVLCYAGGYPDWDADDPLDVAGRLPEEWRASVMHDNGAALLARRLSSATGGGR